jgi:hypothetical protein
MIPLVPKRLPRLAGKVAVSSEMAAANKPTYLLPL